MTIDKQIVFDDKTDKPILKAPKGEKERTLQIPEVVVQIISYAFEHKSRSDLICPAVKSQSYMTKSAYDSAWEAFMNYLNICAGGRNKTTKLPRIQKAQTFTAHQLRHTCATMLFEAGVDIKTAQKFLGHANLQITLEVYTHLRAEKEKMSLDFYNDLLDEKNSFPLSNQKIKDKENEQKNNIVFFPFQKTH